MPSKLPDLTLVTNRSREDYLSFISSCAHSGITGVQLREKNLESSELVNFGRDIKSTLRSFDIPLIVNDSLDICVDLDAEGLHLGQTDGNTIHARKVLGPNKIIGLTVNTLDELNLANNLPLDYIGVGAIFHTNNKSNIQTIWGLDGLRHACKLSVHPVIAIGGIDETNANQVMQSGAYGIAAIGAFHDSNNIVSTVKNLKKTINLARNND